MTPATLRNPPSSSSEASPLLNDRDSTDTAASHATKRSLLARNLLGDGRALITQASLLCSRAKAGAMLTVLLAIGQAGCLLLLGLVLYTVIQNPAGTVNQYRSR